MLKKVLVSALILVYSFSAIGMPLHFHYCRGELKHVSVFVKMDCHVPVSATAGQACCKSSKPHCDSGKTLNTCCDDATQWIQDNLPAICAKSDLDQTINAAIATPVSNGVANTIETPVITFTENNPRFNRSIYLFQCSLMFYG